MSKTSSRTLGRSGIEVSPLGMGCWAIGGPFWSGEMPLGWGEVDDKESIRAIHAALDLGVTLFDTANVYGAGHSERSKEIAARLGITERTVKAHLASIYNKFGGDCGGVAARIAAQ
jgi:diketogulonate reductase-like aldo/keto reductase